MAIVVAMTFVKGPDVEIILFICFRRSSPDKKQLAHGSVDSTPDGPSADKWTQNHGARRVAAAPSRISPPPTHDPDLVSLSFAPL